MSFRHAFLLPAIALLVAAPLPAAEPLQGFDEIVLRGMKAHKVPGLAIAIVKDDQVIHAKGYGVRNVETNEPVTAQSVFAIGSVSKSFTAAALAMLVEDGKLAWNDSLSKHLKDFQLSNVYLSQETTLRDVLSHRVGIGRNEMIWYGSPFSREEILKRLRHTKPAAPFRTRFMYNNILYMAAGQTIPAVTDGTSWDKFVQDRIFEPLGMKHAQTSAKELKTETLASPHDRVKGVPTPVKWKDIDNIGPAGSISASAEDMAQYVRFQLRNGRIGDKRLIKADIFREMHTPQMLIGKPAFSFNPDSHLRAYGLGWMLSEHHGKLIVEHGGNIDGMSAQVGMIPDEKLGVVILANMGGSLLPQAVMFDLFDRFLAQPDLNRAENTALLSWVNELGVQQATAPDATTRVKDTKPSHSLEKYAGRYEDDRHAPLKVTFKDDTLFAEFNGWHFTLKHWHFDTFWGDEKQGVLPGILFTFELGADGRPVALRSTIFTGDDVRMLRK